MIINVENLEDLIKSGVYKILNVKTGKFYVGSTKMSFTKRFQHHVSLLRANKHKNKHLQNSYNKYSEESFELSILEITLKNETLQKEQLWIDKYNFNELYNINPIASGTPNMSKETIEKRRQTMLRKYKNGELIPSFKGKPSWNKGLTKNDIDYSYLKVSKTITDVLKQAHVNTSERSRNKAPDIYVYDNNLNFLGKWRSSKDLEEWSLTNDNNLPIKSRFKNERMGKPVKFLSSYNIVKSAKTNKSYKDLKFSYQPLHQVIDDSEQGELLEA